MRWTSLKRMGLVAVLVLLTDQITKLLVLKYLRYSEEIVIIPGFFRFVHWGNTGAAWSLFYGYNRVLAVVSVLAFVVLFLNHQRFESHTRLGQVALGLMFGGIMGNLLDRLYRGQVIDFLYFYLERRGDGQIGFPAFNIADSAICTGVGLIFLISLREEQKRAPAQASPSTSSE